ncbi:MAG: hypothetical protein AB1531_11265 [Chloroflexota bacterium]
MDNKSAREFCLQLLHAETEDEVIEILKKQGYWADRSVWKPYGDIPNNRSIVGNQQSSAVAALVEKVVNSIDAVLTAECYRHSIDPKSPSAPRSMREAVEKFFNVKEGKIQVLGASERTRLAERIQLIACGTKETPAYMIIDDGEGQCPDQFPTTFLSLVRDNKTRIPFVQGKYNMGGTGVLQFSGKHSFQLIISKRQPDIPSSSDVLYKDLWGVTLIRRMEPAPDQPQSMYVYLAPQDKIISFEADALPIKPGSYPDLYKGELTAGTCIKMWNYKLQRGLKTIATLDLRYELERYLQEPVLPIRIYERRPGYRAHSYDTTASGLATVLADKPENVEFSDTSPLKVPNVGDVSIRIVIIRENPEQDTNDRYPAGIFFTVNGQLHGELGKGFISRKTKLDYVADTMIVVVDCTELPQRIREDLFMASRDRMRQCDEGESLEEAIVEHIKEHPGIKEINARRRQDRLASAISEEETAKVIQSLIRSDPTLAQLFGKGELIKLPGRDIPAAVPYEGRKFPTFFRIHNEPKDGLVKHCPRNRQCRVEFETDATNDYFDRLDDRGHIESHGMPQLLSHSLWNGTATLKFGLPQNASVGDQYRVEILVGDISRLEPFNSEFIIQVDSDAPISPPKPPPIPTGATLAGFPNIIEVYHADWARYGFGEYSALQLRSGEDDELDILVNMDNLYLRNEIARRKTLEPELIRYWFRWGLVLLALGMLNHQKRSEYLRKESEEVETGLNDAEMQYTIIGKASEGLAVTLIPVISQLNRGQPQKDSS